MVDMTWRHEQTNRVAVLSEHRERCDLWMIEFRLNGWELFRRQDGWQQVLILWQITVRKQKGMVVPYVFKAPLTNCPILHYHVGLQEAGMIRPISSEANFKSQCAVLLNRCHDRLLSCNSTPLTMLSAYSYLSTYRRHNQDVESLLRTYLHRYHPLKTYDLEMVRSRTYE